MVAGTTTKVRRRWMIAMCLGIAGCTAQSVPAVPRERASLASIPNRGWGYLVRKLVDDGVPVADVVRVFADPRLPAFDGLDFSLAPRESSRMYQGFRSAESIGRARVCHDTHRDALARASEETGVDASVVAAILHVESGCGRNTGRTPILPRLARLAMANDPENVARNVARHVANDPRDSATDVESRTRARAAKLEGMFYPEVRGVFTMAERLGLDPFDIRGSTAGAFGFPQFLPTAYLRFGADGNGDGHVSLYTAEDAILSCARYLAGYGWRPDSTLAERRRVVWEYNHSEAYIDAVLGLAAAIDRPPSEAATTPPLPAKRRPARASRGRGSARAQARR